MLRKQERRTRGTRSSGAWCHAVEEDEAEMSEDAENLGAVLDESSWMWTP